MHSNTEVKKTASKQWKWFLGLYLGGLVGYGLVMTGLHYVNILLMKL